MCACVCVCVEVMEYVGKGDTCVGDYPFNYTQCALHNFSNGEAQLMNPLPLTYLVGEQEDIDDDSNTKLKVGEIVVVPGKKGRPAPCRRNYPRLVRISGRGITQGLCLLSFHHRCGGCGPLARLGGSLHLRTIVVESELAKFEGTRCVGEGAPAFLANPTMELWHCSSSCVSIPTYLFFRFFVVVHRRRGEASYDHTSLISHTPCSMSQLWTFSDGRASPLARLAGSVDPNLRKSKGQLWSRTLCRFIR